MKAKLAELIGPAANTPVLWPIEDHLHALATERALPDLAVATCTLRFDEAAPALRAVLSRAADGKVLDDAAALLLFRGLHILGGAQDKLAWPLLLRLLRRPDDEVEYLLGDMITEQLPRIAAGVFDGDADSLFDAIVDLSIDEFIRDALLGAATFLTWKKRIDPNRMRRFLTRFPLEQWAPDADYVWIGWLTAIALLGLRDLAPLVYRAWDDGRIPDRVLNRSHFEQDLAAAEAAPDDLTRFKIERLGYIEDVLEGLDWTRRTGHPPDVDEADDPMPPWADNQAGPNLPVTNPWRHVGRNDPCPCGSGRKAKKCCMAG